LLNQLLLQKEYLPLFEKLKVSIVSNEGFWANQAMEQLKKDCALSDIEFPKIESVESINSLFSLVVSLTANVMLNKAKMNNFLYRIDIPEQFLLQQNIGNNVEELSKVILQRVLLKVFTKHYFSGGRSVHP
jgi:hypothetical protein